MLADQTVHSINCREQILQFANRVITTMKLLQTLNGCGSVSDSDHITSTVPGAQSTPLENYSSVSSSGQVTGQAGGNLRLTLSSAPKSVRELRRIRWMFAFRLYSAPCLCPCEYAAI